jgi:hypothetical protein
MDKENVKKSVLKRSKSLPKLISYTQLNLQKEELPNFAARGSESSPPVASQTYARE